MERFLKIGYLRTCLTYEDGCEVGRHCGQDPTLQAVVTNGDEIAAGFKPLLKDHSFSGTGTNFIK